MDLQSSYDAVAAEYAQRLSDELQHKPLDRQLLDRLAACLQPNGIVADLGCGPGHVSRYLRERGVQTIGIDISPGMIAQAKRLNPGLQFQVGDFRALPVANESWAGLVAFYSLLHFNQAELIPVLQECWRVLQPGGVFLLAFHVGEEIRHLDDFWGYAVNLDFFFFRPREMVSDLRAAGFDIEELIERAPYPEVEVQTQRAYILARKPAVTTA